MAEDTDQEAEAVPADPMDEIERQEEAERETDDTNESPPRDIVAYNELRSGADLLRMYQDGDLIIQPDFQRDVVWNSTDQTRFIDSLIKQLPIPSMCFAYDANRNEWLVIDGLQRISTIVRFLNGEDWRLSKLPDIDEILRNKSPATFKTAKPGSDLRKIFSKVQNQTIPINVLRCDFSKRSHNEYLFTIFHRLNSGGLKLNNQEIRNCIYSGSFNKALKEWDNDPNWRAINNMQPGEKYRFAKQEAILRFFAFYYNRDKYKGSVAKFLNDYMSDRRNADDKVIKEHNDLFVRVVKVLAEKVMTDRPAPRIPGTVLEAVMIGVATNLDHLEASTVPHAQQLLAKFRADHSISDSELAEGLSKKDKVDARLTAAVNIFAE
ncbi:DUF262 domain-containing protein [Rhizobium herbae]|uniref:DUF262 domain-containing protein n=1 Tax=Rhizobium herbae TaxID=508661 RepID=A0ABS7H999_9HYPH|nr:DUF262 domain-containing protein [Rhizobium herbae]MBW9063834.1 DUF262 domain-containing protein [Rhizobium herbae]